MSFILNNKVRCVATALSLISHHTAMFNLSKLFQYFHLLKDLSRILFILYRDYKLRHTDVYFITIYACILINFGMSIVHGVNCFLSLLKTIIFTVEYYETYLSNVVLL